MCMSGFARGRPRSGRGFWRVSNLPGRWLFGYWLMVGGLLVCVFPVCVVMYGG